MGLFDFFSMTSIFIIFATIFLILSIYGFITYKMAEQDHKISSMIGLISSMAKEQEFLRHKLSNKFGEDNSTNELDTKKHINLIAVSDDDNGEDDNSDSDSDSDSENEDDLSTGESSDSDSDSKSDNDRETVNEHNGYNDNNDSDNETKVFNINLGNDKINIDIEELIEEDEDDDGISIMSDATDMTKAPNVKSIHLEQTISNTEHNLGGDSSDNMNYLKMIPLQLPEETDYKKMPINKLRNIVMTKKIVDDPSKLKKHDLLKLIEEKCL